MAVKVMLHSLNFYNLGLIYLLRVILVLEVFDIAFSVKLRRN